MRSQDFAQPTQVSHRSVGFALERRFTCVEPIQRARVGSRSRRSETVYAVISDARGRPIASLRDGTLLRDEGGTVWVILGGAKFAVPDAKTRERLFAGQACVPVWSSAIDAISSVPADGTLLREESNSQVYVTLGGVKHKVTACVDPAHVLWAGALAKIP
ncbi:MAG TPA: hypothetical protein VK524_18895 [Polyangiaceae bacterium]|nr:hypothetical protein [Polyangiaceae bacterium]